jgi:hypothetical protein
MIWTIWLFFKTEKSVKFSLEFFSRKPKKIVEERKKKCKEKYESQPFVFFFKDLISDISQISFLLASFCSLFFLNCNFLDPVLLGLHFLPMSFLHLDFDTC